MTAAALKPQLFNHLIATRPDNSDTHSFVASILSVAFHMSLVAALVWASSHVRDAVVNREPDVVQSIMIATPLAHSEPAPSHGSSAPSAQSAAAQLTTPTDIPSSIPPVDAASIPSDFAAPAPGVETGNDARPETPASGTSGTYEGFAVLSTMPRLLNTEQVRRALSNNYPQLLKDSGIGGQALVWVLLGEDGRVERAQLKVSSGHPALDDVALKIAPTMRFSPAMNRNQQVKVWVAVPVVFSVR